MTYVAAVIVLSDRAAAGTRPDGCIPVIRAALGPAFEVRDERILPDDPAALQAALIELADAGAVRSFRPSAVSASATYTAS